MVGFMSILIPVRSRLIAFAWAILPGRGRVKIRFITVAACLVVSLIVTFIAKDQTYSAIRPLLEQLVSGAGSTGTELLSFLQGTAPLQAALAACGGAVVAPAVFFAVFIALTVVSGIITYLVFLITGIVHLATGTGKPRRSPLRILPYAVLQVLITVFVVMAPVASYVECLPPVVDAVASLGAIPDSSEYADDVDVAEAREMIETVESAPLTVVYRTLGGKAFCGALTGFRVNGEKTTLRAEVDAIGHFIAHVGELTEEELADFGSGQTDALRDMADCFEDSRLLPAVAGELVYGATDVWLDADGSGSFLGLKLPDLAQNGTAVFSDLFRHTLEIFHTDARNTQALCADLDTFAGMLDIMIADGVLADLDSGTETLTRRLTTGTTVAGLIAEMEKNPSFVPLINDITTIGMRAMGSTLKNMDVDGQAYRNYTGTVADAVNNIRSQTASPEEQKAMLTATIRQSYVENAGEELPLDDSVLDLYADILLDSFADTETVTADDVAALFEAYAEE